MLHGWFATGRYTSTVLFVLSMSVMLAACWLPQVSYSVAQPAMPEFMGGVLPRVVSMLVYGFSALLLSRQTFFDRGVKWMGALYLWFVAMSTFVNGNPLIAFASLLFLLSVILLLLCQHSANPVGLFYTSFMILGILCYVMPYSLCFIPLYLMFCFITNTFSVRGIAASLLGLLTPLWFVMGLAYVFPDVSALHQNFMDGLSDVFDICFSAFSVLDMLLSAFVLAILIPAIFAFVGSSSPSKPVLRRRMSFMIIAEIYMLLLFCIVDAGSVFFYMCQLPCVAIFASYLLAKKETKLSNVYFVFVNIIIIAIATLELWVRL